MEISKEYLGAKLASSVVVNLIKRKKFDNAVKKLESISPEFVENKKEIVKLSTIAGNQIVKKITDRDAKGIVVVLEDSIRKIKDTMKRAVASQMRHNKEMSAAFLLVSLCAYVNLVMNTIFYCLEKIWPFGKTTFYIIRTMFVAAVIEEIARSAAIEMGIGGKYTAVINMVEFPDYVFRMVLRGVPINKAVKTRLYAIGAHTLFYFIQKIFSEKGKSDLGLFIAILLHYSWNLLSELGILQGILGLD